MGEQGRPGRLVGGRYRLLAELGSGGFGRVWRAVDETLRVDVAVKEVWLPPASSPQDHHDRLLRAQREGRNAAALRDHPGIVAVHDVVVEDDAPWIVMQLVDGDSLQHQIERQGPLWPEQAASMAKVLLAALGAAHTAGITHRDVKPANVLMAADGRALLTDFGIARQAEDTRLTATGGLIGSLEYMAPERFEGVDTPAGDLYSLGILLYQVVEGFSPFRRESPTSTLAAVLLGEAPPPARAGALAPLITGLMARQPEQRPTVAAALAMLERIPGPPAPTVTLMLTPRPPHPPTQPDSPLPPPRRRSARRVGAAALLGLALAGLTAFLVLRYEGGTDHGSTAAGSTSTPSPVSPPSPARTLLDARSSDPVPQTVEAMLPPSFTSAGGVVFQKASGGVHDCTAPDSMSEDVKALLGTDGCTKAITGNYLGTAPGGPDQMMVSVEVFPFADAKTADHFYRHVWPADAPAGSGNFGVWCPTTGSGWKACTLDGWGTHGVDQQLFLRQRYVVHASAAYLSSGVPHDRGTLDAARSASQDIGPYNYHGG